MKLLFFFAAVVFSVLPKYSIYAQTLNEFTSKEDTLTLKTEKIKGFGLFRASAGEMQFVEPNKRYFRESLNIKEFPLTYPQNITNIKRRWEIVDLNRFSTLNLKDNSIAMMCGIRDGKKVFIVDQNNNKDFRDDSVRLFQKMDWYSTSKLIQCRYKIFNGEKIVEDSSWLNIGGLNDEDVLLSFVSQHLESTFSIDDTIYRLGAIDQRMGFYFEEPFIALLSQNGINKDTLLDMDFLKKGEYLNFNDIFYRIETINNDGSQITLVKENEIESKTGTQVGLLAPDFCFKSTAGDSVFYKNLKGKYLLLANLTGCWSKITSYQHYKDLSEKYKGKFEIIGIDNSTKSLAENIASLKLPGKFVVAEENKSIQKSYRPDFSSRTCFLINPEGRIVNKFEIDHWKTSLARTFGE